MVLGTGCSGAWLKDLCPFTILWAGHQNLVASPSLTKVGPYRLLEGECWLGWSHVLMPKPEDWSVASGIGGPWGELAHCKGEGRALVSLGEHRISWEPPPPLFTGLCSDFPGSAFIASWSLLPLDIRLVLIPEVCMGHPVPFSCHCLREA